MKSKEIKNIPTLRFPEFLNDGEWEEKELEFLSLKISDGIHTTPFYDDNGDYYFINGNNLIDGLIVVDENTKRVSKKEYEKHKRDLNQYTILLSINGTIGNISTYNNEKVVLGKSACYININDKKVNQKFVINFLKTSKVKNFFTSELTGSTIKNLSLKTVKNTKIDLPSRPEQQKIADCLSSIDNLITAQSKKVEALKEHKKGLMQQLFPTDGEKVPKLRFPEFLNDGGWEEKKLNKIYTFKVTNSFSRDKLNYDSGLVKNIHYGDIHTKFSTLFDIKKENVPFINSSISLEKIKDDCYCQESDMIFADASEDLVDVGKSIEVINLNNQKLLSGLHTLLARQKENKFITGFGGYLFKSNKIREQIKKESQGTKVLSISGTRLSNINISFPLDKKEQQKIADCLSSIDNLITSESKKVEALKEHKKGLMQQLFPSGDEK